MASAPKKRKSGEIDVALHSMTVSSPFSGGYGMTFAGISPVVVVRVDPRSPADIAGVKVGDLVARVNGHDVLLSSCEIVQSIVKYSQGAALTMDIGRSFPIPASEAEKNQAVVVLQKKIEVEDYTEHNVETYKQTIDDAFKEVQDILGSLEQVVPDVDHGVQEVEVPLYDSDSMSSPPPSSDESEGEPDPLLDFSAEDEFSHVPGKPPVHSQIEAERAIRGMQGIIKGVEERKRIKADEEERQKGQGLVKTETSFVPSFQSGNQQKAKAPSLPSRTAEKQAQKHLETQPQPQHSKLQSQKPVESRPPKQVPQVPSPPPAPVPVKTQRDSPLESPPPPIPPYLPEKRDTFPLSNKPEYQHEWRKETHTYEAVEDVTRYKSRSPPLQTQSPSRATVPLQTQSPSKATVPLRTESPSKATVPLRTKSPNVLLRSDSPNVPLWTESPNVPLRSDSPNVPLRTESPNVPLRTESPNVPLRTESPSTANVPLRRKKVTELLPAPESQGHVSEPHRKQKTFAPGPPSKSAPVTDLQSLEVACSGLPASVVDWKGEELGMWLKQLSPTLYEYHFSCFSKHDITGRTLMKLNDTKLKTMGIDDPKHRRMLATQITRLKIRQEAFELKQLERKMERTLI